MQANWGVDPNCTQPDPLPHHNLVCKTSLSYWLKYKSVIFEFFLFVSQHVLLINNYRTIYIEWQNNHQSCKESNGKFNRLSFPLSKLCSEQNLMPVLVVVAVVSANYRNRQQSSCKRQESPIEKLLQAKLLRKPLFILQLLFSLLLLVCLYEMKRF